MSNLTAIQEIYAAFGRGDVPGILQHLAEDVEWEYGGSTEVPWLETRHGRNGAAEFFAALAALEISHFRVKLVLEGPGVVVVLVDLEATVEATGRPIREEDEVHIWYFNDQAQVTRFRHRVDTAQHAAAYRG